MSEVPAIKIANEIQAINDKIKEKGPWFYRNNQSEQSVIEKRLDDILSYAKKNGVPIKVSFSDILSRIENEMAGEMQEDESYEDSYEESY